MKLKSRAVEKTTAAIDNLYLARDSVVYFAEHYLDLRDHNQKKIILTPDQYSFLFLLQCGELTATKGARQTGKTLMLAIFAAWKAIFSDNENIFYVTTVEQQAQSFQQHVRMLIQNAGFLSEVRAHNRQNIVMNNGAKIHFTSATQLSKVSKGHTISTLLVDEMAFFNVPPQMLLDEIAFFRVTQQTKIHVVSTPSNNIGCAFRRFYERFYEAIDQAKGMTGAHSFSLSTNCPFRSQDYEDQMRAILKPEKFNTEILGNFPI